MLAHIVTKSLRQHALSTLITAGSIALATGLLMAVWAVKDQSMRAFTNVTGGFDAVFGPRGSELNLVLFSVFHMDKAPGTLPWADYEALRKDRRNIKTAVPIVVGDNFKNFRIVGTTTNYFGVEYQRGRRLALQPSGRWFAEGAQEAVLGSFVASRLGLRVGDVFQPYHGLEYDPSQKHEADYLVVGIMRASNTPADHVIWIPVLGAQNMPGHRAEAATDISAVLLQFNSAAQGPMFADQVNKGTRDKTVAMIAPTVTRFFQRFEWLRVVLGAMAALVALVGAGGILASLYNTLNERRRELAILRALGARRTTVFGAMVLEAATISVLGVLGGFAVYAVCVGAAAHFVRQHTGVVIDPWEASAVFIVAPVGIVIAGAAAGVLPAIKAYQTDVAENLVPHS